MLNNIEINIVVVVVVVVDILWENQFKKEKKRKRSCKRQADKPTVKNFIYMNRFSPLGNSDSKCHRYCRRSWREGSCG